MGCSLLINAKPSFMTYTNLLSGKIKTTIKAIPRAWRFNFSMISFSDSHIILSGGCDIKKTSRLVEIYDIKTDSWSIGPKLVKKRCL